MRSPCSPAVETQVDQPLGRREPLLGQRVDVLGAGAARSPPVEGLAAPQPSCLLEQARLRVGVLRLARGRHERPEPTHVDGVVGYDEGVAARRTHHPVRADELAEPGDRGVQRGPDLARVLVAPQVVGQGLAAHRPAGGQRQGGQRHPLASPRHRHRVPVHPQRDRRRAGGPRPRESWRPLSRPRPEPARTATRAAIDSIRVEIALSRRKRGETCVSPWVCCLDEGPCIRQSVQQTFGVTLVW